MGMKPRVKPSAMIAKELLPIVRGNAPERNQDLQRNPALQESLNLAWDALKECAEGIVPHDKRHLMFTDLDDCPKLDKSPIVREIVGWIRGVADALDIEARELVLHVTQTWRP